MGISELSRRHRVAFLSKIIPVLLGSASIAALSQTAADAATVCIPSSKLFADSSGNGGVEGQFKDQNGNSKFSSVFVCNASKTACVVDSSQVQIYKSTNDNGTQQAVDADHPLLVSVANLQSIGSGVITYYNGSNGAGFTSDASSGAAGATSGPTTVGGSIGAPQVSGGSSGPPVLASVDVTNSQAEEFVRQRREQAQQQAQAQSPQAVTPVASPQSQQQGTSSPASTSAPPPIALRQNASSNSGQSASSNDTVMIETDALTRGVWGQLYGDFERHKNLAPGSTDNPTRSQKTFGQIAGADARYSRFSEMGREDVQFGFFGGHNETKSKFSNTPNVINATQDTEGGFVGAYGTYQLGRLSVDSMAKADFFQHTQRSVVKTTTTTTYAVSHLSTPSCPTGQVLLADTAADLNPQTIPDQPKQVQDTVWQLRTGQVSEHNFTLASNAQYRFDLAGGAWFEPTAGIRFTYTDFDTSAYLLNLQDGQVLRLQAGARIGRRWNVGSYGLTTTLLGLVYNDVYVNGFALSGNGFVGTVSNVDEGKYRCLLQANFTIDNGRGLSYGLEAAVRGGEDVWGVGGKLGIRYEW